MATALAELYEREVVERGQDARGYVLVGRDGRSPIGTDTPLEVAQQVQRRAGLVVATTNPKGKPVLRPRVTYHELRHTAATMMLTGGKAAVVVARQLGHRDSRITTQVYEHLLDDGLLDDALDVFADRIGVVADQKRDRDVAGRVAGPSRAEREEAANPLQ